MPVSITFGVSFTVDTINQIAHARTCCLLNSAGHSLDVDAASASRTALQFRGDMTAVASVSHQLIADYIKNLKMSGICGKEGSAC